MPYSTSQTALTIINLVKQHFASKDLFNKSPLFRSQQVYFDAINEALEEIYMDCGYQNDEFSITTVVGQWEYPFDGTNGNFPKNEIDLIVRVDYDGSPLKYQYTYPDDIIVPTSNSDLGTPDGWYEKWDNGTRYLGLNIPPNNTVQLKVYSWRVPVVITSSSGVPAIDGDFYSLIKKIVIRKFYIMMEEFDKAMAYQTAERILEHKRALRNVVKSRKGRKIKPLRYLTSEDLYV